MDIQTILTHPFTWGLALGLLLFVLSFWAHLKTKGEYRRYKKHLSDKMEIEAEQLSSQKGQLEDLKKENENLRVQNQRLQEKPENKLERELEIFARAQQRMNVAAPGFAPAWEKAKQEAITELESEDQGKNLPKRLFKKIFGGQQSLPDHQETETIETESTKKEENA